MTSSVSVAASNAIQLSGEILCPRTARLTAGGLSGLLLTDGARTAYLGSAASIAGWQEHVFTQAPVASTSPSAQTGGNSKARTPPAPVHFVSLSPDLHAAPCQPTTTASSSLPPHHLAAVSTGTQLQVISLGSSPATANPSQRSQGLPEPMGAAAKAGAGGSLGVLAAPQPFTWLNVSWLAVPGSNRGGGCHGSNGNRSTGGEASGGPAAGAAAQVPAPPPGGARACHCLLAAVCQAELRVVLCDPAAAIAAPAETAAAAPDEKAESSAVNSTPASAPHSRCGLRTVGQLLPPPSLAAGGGGGAAPVCRSSQCHVAWVGDCADGAGAVVTLVAAWGADIEVVGWTLRDLLVAPAAPTASTGAGAAAAGLAAALPPPASRRTLLLGVPGPLSAVTPGPWGSVVATTAAALALALTTAPEPPASAAADSDAAAEMDGAISSPGDEAAAVVAAAAAAGAPAAPEVLDLRGRLVGGDGGGELLGGGILGGFGGGEVGPSLAGLFNISSLAAEEAEAGGAAAAARRPVGVLGGASSSAGNQCRAVPGNSSPSLGAVPGRFLLGDAAAAAPPAALCVVWPGRLASPSAPTLSASSSSSSSRPLDAFRALAPLSIPRPDLIAACSGGGSNGSTGGTSSMGGSSGSLVLVGSSMGPPLVAAFGLTPRGGLTPLMTLSPALPPGALDPARGRLRGLALAPAARGGSGAGGGGGAGGGTRVALVVVVGEAEPAVAGAGIVGFGKAPGAGAPPVRLAPLLASVHTLPPQLAAHAAPPLPPPPAPSQPVMPAPAATQAASALTSAPAPAAVAPAPAAPPPAAAPAASADVVAAAVVGQLAELLEGLRRHVDSRLDELSGSVQAQAVRLERLEASVLEKQQQEQKQQK